MGKIFEYLKNSGIKNEGDAFRLLPRLSEDKIVQFAIGAYVEISSGFEIPKTERGNLYNFSVNSSLSGGAMPCSEISCRLRRAIELGGFAALYADLIVIPPFFDYLESSSLNFENQGQLNNFYNRVIGDVILLFYYKPLIKAGVVKINSRYHTYCKKHFKLDGEQNKILNQRIQKLRPQIQKIFLKKIRVTLQKDYSISFDPYQYTGAEVFSFLKFPRSLARFKVPHTFTKFEAEKLKIIDGLITTNLIDEILLQKYSLKNFNLNYLTNIEAEVDLINTIDPQYAVQNSNLVRGISHNLPLIEKPIQDVLTLRERQPKSFELYRSSMQSLLAGISKETSEVKIKKAVQETIIPEINKIERIIEANRIYYLKKVVKNAAISTISITAGIFGNRLFGLDLSNVFAGMGLSGGFFIPKIYDDASSAVEIPQEVLNNNFYFLWKLKK